MNGFLKRKRGFTLIELLV
ncbi:prepilin-type N-terminal cleavage/methylation domain-containing protein [Gimesia chilikensis]